MPSVLLAMLLATATTSAPPDSAANAPAGRIAPADTSTATFADSTAQAAPVMAWRFQPVGRLAGSENERERLVEPAGVATDAFGRVYASDAASHRIVRWDAAGRWLDQAGSLGSDPNQFRRPGAVARLGSLGVAVLDTENRRVVTWDLEMHPLGVLTGVDSEQLQSTLGPITPVALAADRGGAVYVADADGDRVLAFEFSGRFITAFGGHGRDEGRFASLSAVAVGPRGVVVAADRPDSKSGAARLQWFDSGGRPLGGARTVLGSTAAARRSGRPGRLSLAVDDQGRVAAADEGTGVLELTDRSGVCLARLDRLARPSALAFAPDGTLLVAEAGAACVRRFQVVPAAAGK